MATITDERLGRAGLVAGHRVLDGRSLPWDGEARPPSLELALAEVGASIEQLEAAGMTREQITELRNSYEGSGIGVRWPTAEDIRLDRSLVQRLIHVVYRPVWVQE